MENCKLRNELREIVNYWRNLKIKFKLVKVVELLHVSIKVKWFES